MPIISSDTLWKTGEVHDLADSPIQIAHGATLTIEGGVEVKNGDLEVFGKLVVAGGSEKKVNFFDVSILNEGIYQKEATISISHADMAQSYVGGYGYGDLSITDSLIRDGRGVYIPGGVIDSFIERNIFLSSVGIDSALKFGATTYVRDNVFFDQQSTYGQNYAIKADSGETFVEGNTFLSTDRVALFVDKNGILSASDNNFSTTDSDVIASMILDSSDDLNYGPPISASFITVPTDNTPQVPEAMLLDQGQATFQHTGDTFVITVDWAKAYAASEEAASWFRPVQFVEPGYFSGGGLSFTSALAADGVVTYTYDITTQGVPIAVYVTSDPEIITSDYILPNELYTFFFLENAFLNEDNAPPELIRTSETYFALDGQSALEDGQRAWILEFNERVIFTSSAGVGLVADGEPLVLQGDLTGPTLIPGETSKYFVSVYEYQGVPSSQEIKLTLQPQLRMESFDILAVDNELLADMDGAVSSDLVEWVKVSLSGPLYQPLITDVPFWEEYRQDNIYLSNGTFESGSLRLFYPAEVHSSLSDASVIYLGFEDGVLHDFESVDTQLNTTRGYFVDNGSPAFGSLITDVNNNTYELSYQGADEAQSMYVRAGGVWVNLALGQYVEPGSEPTFDIIDLSAITSGPMTVNGNAGVISFYDSAGELVVIDALNYEKFIFNDRHILQDGIYSIGNTFYGTVVSEYVVVGNGGDNYLVGENQWSGATTPETDIVDYSQTVSGITVALGHSAKDQVEVIYKDGTDRDLIFGFEGIVGSAGHDEISGSNIGNYLEGGVGDDILRGYTDINPLSDVAIDILYDPAYVNNNYDLATAKGRAEFDSDSADFLFGGLGNDALYGGAGRDVLIDLDAAEMWGSDRTGFNGDGVDSLLRDSRNSDIAEHDIFIVQGDGLDRALIQNFHLSKEGTGLAGHSYSANDAVVFNIEPYNLGANFIAYNQALLDSGVSAAEVDAALYEYVYSRLEFQTNGDELALKYSDSGNSAVVGRATINGMTSALGEKNRVEAVELKKLSQDLRESPEEFTATMDFQAISQSSNGYGALPDLNIAFALELLPAGTVRGANKYGVLAAELNDHGLNERIYNPSEGDDSILGTKGSDSYEYIVQAFDESLSQAATYAMGEDTIFDIGGQDVLLFSNATIDDLHFSAIRVGRESARNSLQVDYAQKAVMDNDQEVTNAGVVTWQGHFGQGNRQAVEIIEVTNAQGDSQRYALGRASYEYDHKGYAIGGPAITTNNTIDSIMVGQNSIGEGEDRFVFELSDSSSAEKNQSAYFSNYDSGDIIDLSAYVAFGQGEVSEVLTDQQGNVESATVTFGGESFVLDLVFRETRVDTTSLQEAIIFGQQG